MFSIYVDNKPLWTSAEVDKRLIKPTVSLDVNKVGSASFQVLPGHPYYDSFVKMKSIVTIYQDNNILLKGRVYSNSADFYKTKKIEIEGLLGYLNDSIVRAYEFSGSPTDYLSFLIDQHNNQVEEYQRFKLGVVTVKDNNDYIARSSIETPTTWSEISTKLIDKLGGYICIRYEDDGNYIDYLADYTDTSTQNIAFSVNLLDLSSECKADSLATCIIPYGATDEATGEKLNITSVNNGLDYVEDAEAVKVYGRIYEVAEWEDVTIASNLLTKAKAYLSEKVKLTDKLTIKAIDLHLADETIEAFKLGDYVRVYSKPHNLDERVLLTSYSMDLADPANSTITLGLEKSSYLSDSAKDNTNRTDIFKKQIGDTVTEKTGTIISQTQTYVNEQIVNSEENTQTLLKDYVTNSDLGTYKESVSTQFKQTAEDITMSFKNVNDRLTSENGDINRKLTELSKYIRFNDGKIELGESGNKLKTVLDNGRISFIYNDNVEVAYISDQKLYITQAEILERIVIGNYAFIPRANGNLSFKKIN